MLRCRRSQATRGAYRKHLIYFLQKMTGGTRNIAGSHPTKRALGLRDYEIHSNSFFAPSPLLITVSPDHFSKPLWWWCKYIRIKTGHIEHPPQLAVTLRLLPLGDCPILPEGRWPFLLIPLLSPLEFAPVYKTPFHNSKQHTLHTKNGYFPIILCAIDIYL